MTKAVTVLLGLVLCSGTSGQESKQLEAKLVRSPFAGGDVTHVIQEAALDLKEHASGSGDKVAIRLCSKEPMSVALSTAAASPFVILEYLEHYGFSRERVLFLRAEDCSDVNPEIVVTEFWAIPNGATPPPSADSINSGQARLQVVRTGDTIKSAKSYRAALRQLITKLRAKPDAVGVVVGVYNKTPSATLQKNLAATRSVLALSGLARNRYFVRLTRSFGSESEPKYPNLFVVEVSKSAKHGAR